MSIIKVISSTFTIVMSLFVLGHVQAAVTADEITFDKFLGERYIIAIAIIDAANPLLSCGWMNVTRQSNNTNMYTASTWMRNEGEWYVHQHEGVVVDSELHYTSKFAENKQFFCTVQSDSDGQELIIFPKNHSYEQQFAQLLSLNQTISKSTKLIFERMSKKEGLRILYINHEDCD